MLPWRLPVPSLSTPGGVHGCVHALYSGTWPPCFLFAWWAGSMSVFASCGWELPASPVDQSCFALLCLSESARWSPGSFLQKALGEWREG